MNEAEPRAEHVDPMLKAFGWGVLEGGGIRREYPMKLSVTKKKAPSRVIYA